MRRVRKGFSRVETPLFEGMLVIRENVVGDIIVEQVQDDVAIAAVLEAFEITKLKKRVKRLEKGQKVKVFKLRRLKKEGTSQRVDTSDDTVMEDVSNQGRMIVELDRDEDDDIRPIFKAKFNSNMEFLLKSKEQMEEEENKAIESINETLAQKAAKRRKMNEDVEDLKQHLEIMPDEDNDVYTKATPLARKVPVVDYQIVHLNNKPRYKIIRADGTHQLYVSFITLLKNFDREDLESLWSIVKESFSTSKPNNFSNDYLLTTLGAMFGRPDM
nr:hypothetical protein [Tanacetum cinerariifolium]